MTAPGRRIGNITGEPAVCGSPWIDIIDSQGGNGILFVAPRLWSFKNDLGKSWSYMYPVPCTESHDPIPVHDCTEPPCRTETAVFFLEFSTYWISFGTELLAEFWESWGTFTSIALLTFTRSVFKSTMRVLLRLTDEEAHASWIWTLTGWKLKTDDITTEMWRKCGCNVVGNVWWVLDTGSYHDSSILETVIIIRCIWRSRKSLNRLHAFMETYQTGIFL